MDIEQWNEQVHDDEEMLDKKFSEDGELDEYLDFNLKVEFKKPQFELKVADLLSCLALPTENGVTSVDGAATYENEAEEYPKSGALLLNAIREAHFGGIVVPSPIDIGNNILKLYKVAKT
ncbi:hypothetical protein ACH5RR_015352 [Cinchona calisaya]|uniref:Uncharacterized protein n=1 Tax=Cinchona calisaya TaxID=153742 RepID=A0ABD2ZU57_9GENT